MHGAVPPQRGAPKTRPLRELATIEREIVAPEAIADGATYVGLEHIDSDGQFVGLKAVAAGELQSSKFRFGPRHILFGKLRPYLKKTARPTFSGICSTDILPILPGDSVDRDYLFHFLRHPKIVEQAVLRCAGANLPRVSPGDVEQFLVPAPPLSEQRRIADILDKADALRRKRKEAIALTEDLLRSTFLKMFGDPVTNPKGWPSETVDDLCARGANLVDGPFGSSLKPEHYVDRGVKVVRNWNIYDDRFDSTEFKFVTEAKFEEIRRSEVRPGDVLITTKGTVGDVCIAPDLGGPAVLSASGTVRFRLPPDESYLPEFVVAQMTTLPFKRYIRTFEAGSAQQYLNLSAIKKMRLVRPSKAAQQAFSSARLRIRDAHSHAASAAVEADSLFNSVVERAFSARLP